MRASSSVRKVERGVRREECENFREFHGEEERGWCFLGRSSGKISLKVERGVRREERENFREFHGEEERGWCFLWGSSGKISLACGNPWSEGHPSYLVYAIGMAKDL
jgi:hypothetical protein